MASFGNAVKSTATRAATSPGEPAAVTPGCLVA
jgi:hypothetical protein